MKRAKNEEGSSSINMMLLEGLQKNTNTLACHDNRYILSRTIIPNKRRVFMIQHAVAAVIYCYSQ